METLPDFLDRVADQYASRPAVLFRPRYRTEVWTYSRLRDESYRVAHWLRERGVKEGDRVLLWAPNSPWWVATFFGTMRLGAVLVPLDVRSGEDFVARVVSQAEARIVILSRLTAGAWKYPTPGTVIEEMVSCLPDHPGQKYADLVPHDLAEIIFTSGTTGDPKGVMLTHGNITFDAASVNRIIPDLPYFRLLSILPLSHMLEQTVGLLLPLGRGASIYYPASRQSTALFQAFQQYRVTTVILVPQALQLFMDAIEREVRKQGRERMWRRLHAIAEPLPFGARRLLFLGLHRRLGGEVSFFVSGGAPLDVELQERWERAGIRVLQGYGATETAPVVTSTSFVDHNPRSVGKAIDGVLVRVAPDGEILVKGSNVSPGYWRNVDATQETFEDGWYKTGDLGELDGEGYLYLRGRKKNMIVLANGLNVYPEDVERVLSHTGKVRDAIVLGLPTSHGAQVHAVLLLEDGSPDPATIVQDANEVLAPHQLIQGYTVWPGDDFPRTHTLKVKRQEILSFLLERAGEFGRPRGTAAPHRGESENRLLSLLSEASGIPVSHLSSHTTLGEAGFDSLGRVELLAAVESELGIYVDETRVEERTTVRDLEELIQSSDAAERPEFPHWPRSRFAVQARQALLAPLFKALDRIAPTEVLGAEVLDGLSPPVLFVANHTSHLDSPTILKALPRRMRRRTVLAAAADYFFAKRWLGLTVSLLLNAFPFSRTGAVRPTLEYCANLLDNGWSILLYPEGTRSTTGDMGTFKSGVGLLAVDLDVPVVPIRLLGMERVLPKGRVIPRRGGVSVTFGLPLRFPPGTAYDEATTRIEAAVRSLPLAHEGARLHV